jgi:hypothetical protein
MYVFGIEVDHGVKEIVLSQRKYVLELLIETYMLCCRLVVSSIDVKSR